MKIAKRMAIALFIMLMVQGIVWARGGRQEEPGGYLRFTWWGPPIRHERTIEVIELFMRRNPGVVIEPEYTLWAGYWDRLNTLAAAGNLPDIMQQDISFIKQWNDRNLLMDLNPYVQRGLIDLSNWPDAALAAGNLNGRLIALVLGTNAWGMAVDPEVLRRAGITIDDTTWTWAEYERIALHIFRTTGVQTMAPHEFATNLEHISRQFGDEFFSPDQRTVSITHNQAANNAFREYLEMNLRLLAAGALFNPEEAFLRGVAYEELAFSRGRTWNTYCWSNMFIAHQAAAGRTANYIMIPTVSGNREPFGLYLRPSQFISGLSGSPNRDMAARFIDFFVNDLEANRILLAERGVPIPSHVRNDLAGRVDSYNRYIFDYITRITPFASAPPPPHPPRAAEVFDAMRDIVLRTMTGGVTAGAAVPQTIQAANAILSR